MQKNGFLVDLKYDLLYYLWLFNFTVFLVDDVPGNAVGTATKSFGERNDDVPHESDRWRSFDAFKNWNAKAGKN